MPYMYLLNRKPLDSFVLRIYTVDDEKKGKIMAGILHAKEDLKKNKDKSHTVTTYLQTCFHFSSLFQADWQI